jgi:hypothetical protein
VTVRPAAGIAGRQRSERRAEYKLVSRVVFVVPRVFLIAARSAGWSHAVIGVSLIAGASRRTITKNGSQVFESALNFVSFVPFEAS